MREAKRDDGLSAYRPITPIRPPSPPYAMEKAAKTEHRLLKLICSWKYVKRAGKSESDSDILGNLSPGFRHLPGSAGSSVEVLWLLWEYRSCSGSLPIFVELLAML